MKSLDPLFESALFAISLREGLPVATFKEELQRQYGETILIELSVEDRKSIQQMIGSIRTSLILVAGIFLLIVLAILFNDSAMYLYQFGRSLGILKSMGMTPRQIRPDPSSPNRNSDKFLFVSGIPVAVWLSPILISQMTRGLGLETFPFVFHLIQTMWVVPGMMLYSGMVAWIASGTIANSRPKEVVVNYLSS